MRAKQTGLRALGIITLLLTLAGAVMPNWAAGETVVAIDPPQVTIPLGNQVVLQLQVRNGVNVNAFDVTLTYDQGHLSLASWAHGDYLSDLNCVHQLNQPGRLELACTQVARPAVSGDGVLLEMVFNTLTQGSSEVRIQQAILANPQGATVQPERQHGAVTVGALPTYTPTRTATRTPTPTSTHTRTATAPPMLTATLGSINTAYPGESDATETLLPPADVGVTGITRTITATPPGEWPATHTQGVDPVTGDESQSGEPGVSDRSNDVDIGPEAPIDQPAAKPFVEVLLWVVFGVSLAVLAAVAILWITRKSNKKEDYLL